MYIYVYVGQVWNQRENVPDSQLTCLPSPRRDHRLIKLSPLTTVVTDVHSSHNYIDCSQATLSHINKYYDLLQMLLTRALSHTIFFTNVATNGIRLQMIHRC